MTSLHNVPIFERLQREDAREAFEKKKLSEFAWEASSQRKLRALPKAKLELAAKLADQPGELGAVGRAARYELERRKAQCTE